MALMTIRWFASWVKDRVRSCDVMVAKNYLRGEEMTNFNRLLSSVLDFVVDMALNGKEILMPQWEGHLDNLLKLMGRRVLRDRGVRKMS